MYFLGVDIGGTDVKIGLVDNNGNIYHNQSYSVNFDNYNTPIIISVQKYIDLFVKQYHIDLKNISGIGVSATGQIDANSGIVIGCGSNIKNWENTNIKQILQQKYNLKTTVINDANAVALGELWIGNARGFSNVIVITIGTGIGGGIIVNSKLLNGSTGIAGEIGHFSINYNGNKCCCGNFGCYETYGSMTALVNTVKNNNQLIDELHITPSDINGKLIFQFIDNKNVNKIIQNWINFIASGIISLTHIFNPEIILIGGGVSKQEYFINNLKQKVFKNLMPNFKQNLILKQAKLYNTAGMVGAVYYLINNYN